MSADRKVTDFFRPLASRVMDRIPVDDDDDVEDSITVTLPTKNTVSSSSKYKEFRTGQDTDESPAAKSSHDNERPQLVSGSDPVTDEHLGPEGDDVHTGIQSSSSATVMISSAGQRITKNGKIVIKSSDDEDSDSESSLDDLNDLLSLPTTRPRTRAQAIKSTGDQKRPHLTPGSSSSRRAPLSTALPATPRYKFSIASLVDQTERDHASDASVAKAKVLLAPNKDPSRPPPVEGVTSNANDEDDGNQHGALLSSVLSEDRDQIEMRKVMHAMKRTEALNRPKVWHFFADTAEAADETIPARKPFPVHRLSPSGWQFMLSIDASRTLHLLSGFVGETASTIPLPDDITFWMLDEICLECRGDLIHAYINVLKSAPEQISRILSPERMGDLFRAAGGILSAVRLEEAIRPYPVVLDSVRTVQWKKVLSVITLLNAIAPHLSMASAHLAICMLLRVTLDTALIDVADVRVVIEDALVSLLEGIPENEWEDSLIEVGRTVIGFTSSSPFRLQLLKCMPVMTTRVHLFRRRLALSFFFLDDAYLAASSPLRIRQVTDQLRTARFHVNNDTDYSELAAAMSILDIGLDDGRSSGELTDRAQEDAFNDDVDELAKKVKSMFSTIVDSGASHMTRTEAKEVLERMHYRLVYAVRTKQRPRKQLFQSTLSDGASGEPRPGIMARVLAKSSRKGGEAGS